MNAKTRSTTDRQCHGSAARPFQIVALLGVALCTLAAPAFGVPQDRPAQVSDVERMVREGMVEALQSRFRGGRTPEELRLLKTPRNAI
jgi:hypothetical protein